MFYLMLQSVFTCQRVQYILANKNVNGRYSLVLFPLRSVCSYKHTSASVLVECQVPAGWRFFFPLDFENLLVTQDHVLASSRSLQISIAFQFESNCKQILNHCNLPDYSSAESLVSKCCGCRHYQRITSPLMALLQNLSFYCGWQCLQI